MESIEIRVYKNSEDTTVNLTPNGYTFSIKEFLAGGGLSDEEKAQIALIDQSVSVAEKTVWNAKQSALTADQLTKINAIDQSISNAEKTVWSNKQDQLTAGQLAKINATDQAVSIAEKIVWGNKQDALSAGQIAKINVIDQSVSSAEKNIWSAKQNALTPGVDYVAPVAGKSLVKIIDNLTVGGAGDGLSAEQGKILNQNKLDRSEKPVLFSVNGTAASSPITGVTTNTIIQSYLIPANTFKAGSIFDVRAVITKSTTVATSVFQIHIRNVNSISSGAGSIVGTVSATATNQHAVIKRTVLVRELTSATAIAFNSVNSATDDAMLNTPGGVGYFDCTVDNWVIVTILPSSASDSYVCETITIKGTK